MSRKKRTYDKEAHDHLSNMSVEELVQIILRKDAVEKESNATIQESRKKFQQIELLYREEQTNNASIKKHLNEISDLNEKLVNENISLNSDCDEMYKSYRKFKNLFIISIFIILILLLLIIYITI